MVLFLCLALSGVRSGSAPVVLSDQTVVLNKIGKRRVIVKLMSPKPARHNGLEGYEGRVLIRVRVGRKPWVESDISELLGDPAMQFFDADWKLVFADYNQDGQTDFNLGQPCGSNNFCYWLFTVDPSGRVLLLPLPSAAGRQGFLWINDDNYSTGEIKVGQDGFSCWAYDPAEGAGVEVRYRWNEAAHGFEAAERTVGKQGNAP